MLGNMQLVFPWGHRPVYIHVQVQEICRKPLIQWGKDKRLHGYIYTTLTGRRGHQISRIGGRGRSHHRRPRPPESHRPHGHDPGSIIHAAAKPQSRRRLAEGAAALDPKAPRMEAGQPEAPPPPSLAMPRACPTAASSGGEEGGEGGGTPGGATRVRPPSRPQIPIVPSQLLVLLYFYPN
jgi:hypothetical protein